MTREERPSTASRAGYHYLSTYQSCRWRWYLHHVRHIIPEKTSRYLLYGQAFHAAMEAFYRREVTTQAAFTDVGVEWLTDLKPQYEKLDQFTEDLVKMRVMTAEWWNTFAADEFEKYDVLAIEEEMLIMLPGGFVMTVRPDVVVQSKEDKSILLFEHKTTSRSVHEMARSVACQQQVDAQLLGLKGWLKERDIPTSLIVGVVPNIVYSRQSVKRAERTAPIMRSVKELADSQLSFAGLFSEIGQKVTSLQHDEGLPAEALFDRNGAWCAQFGCEYESICRARFTSPPPGFVLERSQNG